MAFAVLLWELTRCPFLSKKSATAKSPRRLSEPLVGTQVLQSDVQIRVLPIADHAGRFDEESLPYLRDSIEDCARSDPAWAAWATARTRQRAIRRCGPRSISEAITDILTQAAEVHRDP
jgi:hypothetical protein